jgi:uncharacterized protein (UPF0276 family)
VRFPDLGLGLGLRAQHAEQILRRRPRLGFLELLTENHLRPGRRRARQDEQLADAYPVVLHGVSLNLGSADPLDRAYLREVRALAERTRARWVSDHVCWTGVGGRNSHDLLPLPHTEATLRHVAARVRAVQDVLGQALVLENATAYLTFAESTMPEPEFLARLCEATGCALLVDVNNAYVNAVNHGFDPHAWLAALPPERVAQLHLAGHRRRGAQLVDTHDAEVAAPVWELYAFALRRFGLRSTLLEWDAALPALDVLLAELAKAEEARQGGARAAA